MTSDFYFTVTSWFPENFYLKPHFNAQCPPSSDYKALRRPCSYFSAFTIIPDRPVSNNNLEFEELTKKQAAAAGWPDLVKWDSILLCFQKPIWHCTFFISDTLFILFYMIFFSKPSMQAISNQEEG